MIIRRPSGHHADSQFVKLLADPRTERPVRKPQSYLGFLDFELLGRTVHHRNAKTIVIAVPTQLIPIAGTVENDAVVTPEPEQQSMRSCKQSAPGPGRRDRDCPIHYRRIARTNQCHLTPERKEINALEKRYSRYPAWKYLPHKTPGDNPGRNMHPNTKVTHHSAPKHNPTRKGGGHKGGKH